AWTGENTNTFLCIDCVEDLINKVQNGILTGDKNIIWAINKMKREEFFDLFKNSDKLTQLDKSEIDKIQKEMENYLKNKISTFGGLELLKKFKEKMEGENEKIKKI
ncbi:MAG TPA: hypothetical protein P5513_07530, partial [Candidatus Diapherotrites archaeon]|nr:hypothetical protein [Candidatus Diapherotrites archaeon]